MRLLPGPARLLRTVAVAEAVTWALLLVGMVLKYGTRTTELGVQVFGMAHGVVVIAYALCILLVSIDQAWSPTRGLLGLLAAVPPFASLLVERTGGRGAHHGRHWRLGPGPGAAPTSLPERGVAVLLAHPARAVLLGLGAVAALTVAALALGPPV